MPTSLSKCCKAEIDEVPVPQIRGVKTPICKECGKECDILVVFK